MASQDSRGGRTPQFAETRAEVLRTCAQASADGLAGASTEDLGRVAALSMDSDGGVEVSDVVDALALPASQARPLLRRARGIIRGRFLAAYAESTRVR